MVARRLRGLRSDEALLSRAHAEAPRPKGRSGLGESLRGLHRARVRGAAAANRNMSAPSSPAPAPRLGPLRWVIPVHADDYNGLPKCTASGTLIDPLDWSAAIKARGPLSTPRRTWIPYVCRTCAGIVYPKKRRRAMP